MDVNRQAWAAATSLLVHPAELYVGLRSERTFVERGQPLEIEVIVTDLDGDAGGRPAGRGPGGPAGLEIRARRLARGRGRRPGMHGGLDRGAGVLHL